MRRHFTLSRDTSYLTLYTIPFIACDISHSVLHCEVIEKFYCECILTAIIEIEKERERHCVNRMIAAEKLKFSTV